MPLLFFNPSLRKDTATLMGYQQIAPPDAEPVSLDDCKSFLRIDPDMTADDAQILMMARGARRWCESWTERYFITQTWRVYLDAFPRHGSPGRYGLGYGVGYGFDYEPQIAGIPPGTWFLAGTRWAFRLPFPPCQQALSVSYLDPQGTTQVLALGTGYVVDTVSQPARITPPYGTYWPFSQLIPNSVWCDFVCGYGEPKDVPEGIKIAILMLTLFYYDNRGVTDQVPEAVKQLLWEFRDEHF